MKALFLPHEYNAHKTHVLKEKRNTKKVSNKQEQLNLFILTSNSKESDEEKL